MLDLVFAIILTALINIFLRVFSDKKSTRYGSFLVNYLICAFFGFIFIGDKAGFFGAFRDGIQREFILALIIGIVGGILYLAGFVIQALNIEKNGLVLASVFMKMGLLVTLFFSVVLYKQSPDTKQIAGIVLAILAIIIFNLGKNSGDEKEGNNKNFIWLIVLLLCGGTADSMISVYDHYGTPEFSDAFLFLLFFFALVSSVVMFLTERKRMSKGDVVCGIFVGLPNYFASRFVLRALKSIPAVIAYPINSVMVIVLVSLCGVLIFKEKFSKQKLAGLLIAIIAVILLS